MRQQGPIKSRLSSNLSLAILALVALLVALGLASAWAASPAAERSEYVKALESICRPGVARTQRAVAGERADVEAERFDRAAAKLAHAARIFTATVARIEAVPRPPADAAQLAKWFAQLHRQESYLRKAAAALRRGWITSYQHNAVRFVHNGNLANDIVLVFGFNYCRFKFSRFER